MDAPGELVPSGQVPLSALTRKPTVGGANEQATLGTVFGAVVSRKVSPVLQDVAAERLPVRLVTACKHASAAANNEVVLVHM